MRGKQDHIVLGYSSPVRLVLVVNEAIATSTWKSASEQPSPYPCHLKHPCALRVCLPTRACICRDEIDTPKEENVTPAQCTRQTIS